VQEKKGFTRKHFFIDQRLQGRYMITFLIPMVIMLVFMLFTVYTATQSIITTSIRILREDIDNKIAVHLQDKPDPAPQTYQNLISDIKEHVTMFSTNERYRQAVLSSLLWVFGTGLLIVIVQVVLLTIFFSHKLAGPIYRFERMYSTQIEGDYTGSIRLRKGDEMQNLASLYNEATELTRKRLTDIATAKTEEERAQILKSIKI
jgi:nitrogen fixation/metabolism regulation signal transduction histidine kinase